MRNLILTVTIFFLSTGVALAQESRISFPADYKSSFVNYLNLDRTQNDDQIIRLFASKEAVEGAKATGELPNGSVLVAEIYKAKVDADGKVMVSTLGRRIIDKFALVAVMEKQDGWGDDFAEGLRNGDWDFAAFKPDGTAADKDIDACRACHSPLTDTDHLFSLEHIK